MIFDIKQYILIYKNFKDYFCIYSNTRNMQPLLR